MTPVIVDARWMARVLLLLLGLALVVLAAFVASPASHAAPPPTAAPTPTPYSHASDYRWVAGRLEHSDLEGGFWTIRYQKSGTKADKYGGHFVLILDKTDAAAMQEGAMVVLYGRVRPDMMGIQMAGTYFEVTQVRKMRALRTTK